MRQALAGHALEQAVLRVRRHRWLRRRIGRRPTPPPDQAVRNRHWFHMTSRDVISMPDKWEYPWFAAWDLAFHCSPLSLVDPDFAKEQLGCCCASCTCTRTARSRPTSGTSATSTRRCMPGPRCAVYIAERDPAATGDRAFLGERVPAAADELHLVGQPQRPADSNVFQGGFLGLDNIGVFDRSAPLPDGRHLEQADGTAWMALFCQSDARDRARAGRATIRATRTWP